MTLKYYAFFSIITLSWFSGTSALCKRPHPAVIFLFTVGTFGFITFQHFHNVTFSFILRQTSSASFVVVGFHLIVEKEEIWFQFFTVFFFVCLFRYVELTTHISHVWSVGITRISLPCRACWREGINHGVVCMYGWLMHDWTPPQQQDTRKGRTQQQLSEPHNRCLSRNWRWQEVALRVMSEIRAVLSTNWRRSSF